MIEFRGVVLWIICLEGRNFVFKCLYLILLKLLELNLLHLHYFGAELEVIIFTLNYHFSYLNFDVSKLSQQEHVTELRGRGVGTVN